MMWLSLGYTLVLSLMLQQGPETQPRGYAFYRPILGGARPGRIAEEGTERSPDAPAKTKAQCYFYWLSPFPLNARDTAALWIEGQRASYRVEQVSLPVIQASSMFPGQFDTLLSQKSGYAYQLVLNSSDIKLSPAEGKPSGIEWYYRRKGKMQRCEWTSWKALTPLALP